MTWASIPERDGRTLFIGWMGNWEYAQQVPTHPWRSAMTLPRELILEFQLPPSGQQRVTAELFADDGANVMTETFFPSREFGRMTISANGQGIELTGATVYELGGIWPVGQ